MKILSYDRMHHSPNVKKKIDNHHLINCIRVEDPLNKMWSQLSILGKRFHFVVSQFKFDSEGK